MNYQGMLVQFLAVELYFSPLQSIQSSSDTHLVSCSVCIWGKVAGLWS